MIVQTRQFKNSNPIPTPIIRLNDDFKLLLAATPWGSPQASETAFGEVEQYLSAALQDSEVTTPFEKFEFYQARVNELRISMMLANEKIYRTLNREEYISALEITILHFHHQTLNWCSVGNHQLSLLREGELESIAVQSSANTCGFPDVMLGLYHQCLPRSGSLVLKPKDRLFLQSSGGEIFSHKEIRKPFPEMKPRETLQKGLWFSEITGLFDAE